MSFKSSSFKKRSYTLKIENEKNKGKRPKLKPGVDNLGFNFWDEPKLTEFIIEGRNGEKNKSRDYSKGWNIDDHEIPLESLLSRYGSDPDRGLSAEQVKKNLETYGPNVLYPPKASSEILKFLSNVLLGLNLLLWIAGVISIITFFGQYAAADADDEIDYGNLTSGGSLIVVVLVAGTFAYYQEFQSSKIIDSFKNMVPQFTYVWREGKRQEMDVGKLVVGDIVEVKYGDRVPADIRILESMGFKVDNSSLTGEQEPQKRNKNFTDKDPMETQNLAFFSTNAVEGTCKGIVVRTGGETFMGKLAALASQMDATSTPIAKEMTRIIIIMTTVSLLFGFIFFGIGLSMKYSLMDTLFFVLGIVIANVPENLNVALTIILALTARKLAAKNCIVKHLHAVETLGSASVICSDKTGTLTMNKMSVAHMYFSNSVADADVSEFENSGATYDTQDAGFRSLANVAILCSRARFKPDQAEIPILKREVEGDASETAILKFMELQFGNVETYRDNFPKVCEIPFNSSNKFQVSIHNLKEPYDPRFLLVMKGAPEKLIAMCTTILVGNDEYPLTDRWRAEVDKQNYKFGSLGERVLAFADCRLPTHTYPSDYVFDPDYPDFLKAGLRFVGLVSMIDPPRASVPLAVSKCRSAGIKVVMVTGDHPITAKAIARAVGIFSPENRTIEELAESFGVNVDEIDPLAAKAVVVIGSELNDLSSDQLCELLTSYDEIVFARTSPEQKYLIVSAFQRLGNVVAVTGDGVNDSPALKRADIGVAMGLTGTDVAKEVADLVLMDDNFATIMNGVEEGRLIFDNLKKLIRYTFADNVAEMYCYWVFIILKVPLPMGTLAMLLSTLAIDMGPATSLAHEQAESDIMKLKPRNPKKDTLVTAQVLSYSYGQVAVIETFAGFLAYFVTFGYHGWLPNSLINIQQKWDSMAINDLEDSYGQEWAYSSRQRLEIQAQTAFFAALVVSQWFNAVACKTRRLSIFQQGLRNHFMNFALCLTPCIACLFIYTDGLNDAVEFEPLQLESWLFCFPFALLLFVYDELRRLAVRSFPGGWIAHEFTF